MLKLKSYPKPNDFEDSYFMLVLLGIKGQHCLEAKCEATTN